MLVRVFILMILFASSSVSAELLISYFDGCEFPDEFSMFDVGKIEIYLSSKSNYTLVVEYCKMQNYSKGLEINWLGHVLDVNKDARRWTGRMNWGGVDYRVYYVIHDVDHNGAVSWLRIYSYWPEKIVVDREKTIPGWVLSKVYNMTIPSYVVVPGVSELRYVSNINIRLYDLPKGDYSIGLSEIKDRWVTLVEDDYDGLPLDLRSIKARLDKDVLTIRYEFYNPLPKPWKGASIHCYLPDFSLAEKLFGPNIFLDKGRLDIAWHTPLPKGINPLVSTNMRGNMIEYRINTIWLHVDLNDRLSLNKLYTSCTIDDFVPGEKWIKLSTPS